MDSHESITENEFTRITRAFFAALVRVEQERRQAIVRVVARYSFANNADVRSWILGTKVPDHRIMLRALSVNVMRRFILWPCAVEVSNYQKTVHRLLKPLTEPVRRELFADLYRDFQLSNTILAEEWLTNGQRLSHEERCALLEWLVLTLYDQDLLDTSILAKEYGDS